MSSIVTKVGSGAARLGWVEAEADTAISVTNSMIE